ncbi:MAG TPA: histone [Candidatus Bathyarchaeota archaeon]|nr:MAG: histone [Candidatus Bathyarchaeota archaeon]HDJ26609.1 histone [Candidatus Bathyarchaeota archaeon]
MPRTEFSRAAAWRIIKRAGAERVSHSAARKLAEILEEVGLKIAKEALDYAQHAGRKTVKEEDVLIAAKKVVPALG